MTSLNLPKHAGLLVVDDDLPTLVMMTEVLQSNYDVYVAKSGEHALAIAGGTVKPELILLDVNMPDMNGYEILTKLKQSPDTAAIPVIFVTGRGSDDDFTKGFDLGAVDYVVKPFSPAILNARVRTHISLARKTKELETLAITDPLTKIANRRHYDEMSNKEWARSIRREQPLSLIVMDIDDFKAYNDNYGHGKGDDVLTKFGRILDNCCQRTGDLPARIGGEEFVVLLPDTLSEGAQDVARSIQTALSDAAIPHPYSSVGNTVTFSAGIVTMIPVNGKVPQEMFELADKALYSAKEQGKDRYVSVVNIDNVNR